MSLKVADYQIKEAVPYGTYSDSKELPRYSFVKPISPQYVPKHIWSTTWIVARYNAATDVICYTSAGLIPIRKDLIIEV